VKQLSCVEHYNWFIIVVSNLHHLYVLIFLHLRHASKKFTSKCFVITSSSTDWFLKFFYWYTLQEDCNKESVDMQPHLKHIATLSCEILMFIKTYKCQLGKFIRNFIVQKWNLINISKQSSQCCLYHNQHHKVSVQNDHFSPTYMYKL